MCGVPVHAADAYLARLIRKRLPRRRLRADGRPGGGEEARRAKAVVRRDVVRVVTPGTLTEDALLDARRHNYLAALAEAQEPTRARLARHVDRRFPRRSRSSAAASRAALARLDPGEMLLPDRLLRRAELFELFQRLESGAVAAAQQPRFDSDNGGRRLQKLYGVQTLDGVRRFQPGGAGRGRRAARLRRADAEGQAAAPVAAAPPGRRRGAWRSTPPTRRNLELSADLARRARRARCSRPSTAP